MFRKNIKKVLAGLTLGFGIAAFAPTAEASDCYVPCTYKRIIVHKTIEKPCVHYVTKYTHCGNPYQVRVVTTKLITVPVAKWIKVCH